MPYCAVTKARFRDLAAKANSHENPRSLRYQNMGLFYGSSTRYTKNGGRKIRDITGANR